MATILTLLGLLSQTAPQWADLLTRALAAHNAGDQATLDKIHDEAVALAEANKPDDI